MYPNARLYNTMLPLPVFTLIEVEKRVSSPRLPWSLHFLQKHLVWTSDLVRLLEVPGDRLRIRLGRPPHSLMPRAGSRLLGILRSVLRDQSPSGRHPDLPPLWTFSPNVGGWRIADTTLREPGSYPQNGVSVDPSTPITRGITLTKYSQIPVYASPRFAPAS